MIAVVLLPTNQHGSFTLGTLRLDLLPREHVHPSSYSCGLLCLLTLCLPLMGLCSGVAEASKRGRGCDRRCGACSHEASFISDSSTAPNQNHTLTRLLMKPVRSLRTKGCEIDERATPDQCRAEGQIFLGGVFDCFWYLLPAAKRRRRRSWLLEKKKRRKKRAGFFVVGDCDFFLLDVKRNNNAVVLEG